ncbi:unnamed protein product [Symbiodinium sp. CCMP2456]|nr:unnamed protein product [Symbiodinium sp. CCMP2456]
MDRAIGLLDFCGGRLQIVCLLDAASLGRVLRCSKAAQVVVKHEWRCCDGRFETFNATHLESELVGLWSRYGQSISQLPMKKPRTAHDVYCLWPSRDWFKEGELPFTDLIQFERGDSSYNVWILDLLTALPLLGRLVSDLYIRSNSKAVFQMRGRNDAPGAAEFLQALKEQSERKAAAELSLKRCYNEGRGFVMESVFMTWDRKELWIYGEIRLVPSDDTVSRQHGGPWSLQADASDSRGPEVPRFGWKICEMYGAENFRNWTPCTCGEIYRGSKATAAAIFVAEEREALNSPSNVQKLGRSRRHQDVPHKEVWANTCQSNLLFEVWRPPELVKDWEWELPAPPASLPASAARVKPGRLKRSWTVSSEQWMPTSTRGDEPPTRTASAGIRCCTSRRGAWLSDNGEFVRPTPLKARIRMEAPVPSPSPPATFHQRAATAAAWVFGRRQVPEPVNTLSQDQDPEAQADLLVTEMREQLKHTCKEPLQVRKLIFRDLQRQLHPDKNTECEEAAKHAFQKLMEERRAYLGAEPAGFGQASESNK